MGNNKNVIICNILISKYGLINISTKAPEKKMIGKL